VAGGLRFAMVSAGFTHTCGVTTEGTAYCWGYNYAGQLGNGTATTVPQPSPVAVAGGLRFAKVSAGFEHTCGVTTGGAAYCWGHSGYGQLGNGDRAGPESCNQLNADPCSMTPAAVVGGLSFATVSAGGLHTCGVTTEGAAYCWGDNTYGQLGNGNRVGPENCPFGACSAAPVAVVSGLSFAMVSAENLNTCGVTTGNAAYCWGYNFYGQLGDGTKTDRTSPVAVAGGLGFTSVSTGGYHTCGLTTEGAAYCWGYNSVGQLGDGTTNGSPVPVRVVP
jgi:alpha-tubulin suppressor-like RCC1 family protein